MKIIIDDYQKPYDKSPPTPKKRCFLRLQGALYLLSLGRVLAILSMMVVIICATLLFKMYIKFVLLWLEKQNSLVIAAVICVLFILVALPVSIGYIILVLSSGYLFGVPKGLILVISGANFGLLIAHNILKAIGHHPCIYKFTQNETADAIMKVISGPLCFKIVFCSRLTPIPFGLQNTIFALSNVSAKVYHLASFFGLLPAQFVVVYVGSTLRSMQDVFENHTISPTTYVFAGIQLMLGATLMIWIGSKARAELMKALAAAETMPAKTSTSFMV